MYQDELKKDFQKSLQDQNQKKTRKGRIIEQQESYIPSTNDMRTFKINESFTKSEGYRPRQELLQKYQSSPSYYTEIEPS